jgi:NADH-quinone oxidoreductase B subunit
LDMKEGTEAPITLLDSGDFLSWFDRLLKRAVKISHVDQAVDWVSKDFFNWAQRNSLYPLHFGIACCALESPMATADPRYDMERFGVLPRSTPRQCDLLIVNGPISKKLKDKLITLYEQMPEPKWVIAMGECAISGGPFWESYNVIEGVDKLIPVDIYLPGCPPRPEAFLDALFKLQEKIIAEKEGMFATDEEVER